MKNVLLLTLKYILEQVSFYSPDFNHDSPLGILWPSVETIYKITEKCVEKELLKDYAF